jgi:hypothetical protein
MAITVKEACIEVLEDLIHKSSHMDTCALRSNFSLREDYFYPLCSCGHLDGLEAAWDLMAILNGDGA